MKIKIFKINAFTKELFKGNPAAVCYLENELPELLMQNIAYENALPETAFIIKISNQHYKIRWFTPEIEMDLCGHATLASAFVIFNFYEKGSNCISFSSRSGALEVKKLKDLIFLNFPARTGKMAVLPEIISRSLSIQPDEILKSRDFLLIYKSQEVIENLLPNQEILTKVNIDPGGIIISSIGTDCDFVSRFFTPQASIFEDPVTGSAHCTLIPYWSKKLNKKKLIAKQLSKRSGVLHCEDLDERVLIAGNCILFLAGFIKLKKLKTSVV